MEEIVKRNDQAPKKQEVASSKSKKKLRITAKTEGIGVEDALNRILQYVKETLIKSSHYAANMV